MFADTITAEDWKQPICPTIEGLNTFWDTHTTEHCVAIKNQIASEWIERCLQHIVKR